MERYTKKQHSARRKLFQRILAAVLAFAMVLSTSLLLLTRIVQPESADEEISQSTADSAYQAISDDSAYLSASAAERVRMLLGVPLAAALYRLLREDVNRLPGESA